MHWQCFYSVKTFEDGIKPSLSAFRLLQNLTQGLLEHTVISEVEELDGMYKQAFDRIINQVVVKLQLVASVIVRDDCSYQREVSSVSM